MLSLNKRSRPCENCQGDEDRKDTSYEEVGNDRHGRFAAMPDRIRLTRGTNGVYHYPAWLDITSKCFEVTVFHTEHTSKNGECRGHYSSR